MCQNLVELAADELNFGIHPNLTKANSNFTFTFNTDSLN